MIRTNRLRQQHTNHNHHNDNDNDNSIAMSPLLQDPEERRTAPIMDDQHNHACSDGSTMTSAQSSYWCSYRCVELLFCFLTVLIGMALEFASPFERPIPYQIIDLGDDVTAILTSLVFGNSQVTETVPNTLMAFLAMFLPFAVQMVLVCVVNKGRPLRRTEGIHQTACVYFLGFGVTQALTNVAKLYVGYWRPNFYDLCQPDADYQDCTSAEDGIVDHGRQARLSFPSGHASMSFCGLLLLSLFLEHSFGQTAVERKRRASEHTPSPPPPNPPKLIKILSMLCYSPMLVAFFIAISRVHDNYHHPADIVGGSLLGGVIASLVFGIWYV